MLKCDHSRSSCSDHVADKNVFLSVSHLLNSLVGMGQAAMFKCCPVEYFLIIFTINCVSVRYVRNI
jgi:hypothetical protein